MGVRQFFDSVQEATESGGRQKAADGSTLVGRYRDGSLPPPEKRAYGAGQMQVATARRVAASHGIDFNMSRFMNDKEYNLDLADRHMGDLIRKYGDRTIARAAYHSGEGTVDRAITKYGREGFAQGLGPEGRKYIQMGTRSGAGPAGSRGVGNVLDIASSVARTPTLPAEARASQGVDVGPTDKVFGSDAELRGNFQAIDQNLQETSGVIDVLRTAQAAAHATQITARQQQVQDTQAISDEITSGVQALKRQVQPVFEARQRVNDQLDHITTMNPLERAVRGVFDLNYDKDFLTGQLDSYDRTLKARAADFDYLNHLNGVALQEIDRRYALATALPELAVTQGKEDLGLLGQNLANLSGMLANNQGEIQSQVQMIQAKQAARGDLLDRLDINTIQDLANQARQAGGNLNYQGMDFSYHELYERLQKHEQQQTALEGMRIGIESQRMDFAEKQAVNIVQTMTKGQLEAAIQNGGVWNGVQLPQDALTSAYQGMLQREQLQAESYMQSLPAKAVGDFVTQAAQQDIARFNRASGLFGNQDMVTAKNAFNNQTRLYQELTQAIRTGQPNAVINALQTQIAAGSKSMEDHVDQVILRNAGGDKRAAGYIKSFVYGSPINAGTATEAITYFAIKGGMPEGMMASPEARAIFQRAQSVVRQHQGEQGMTEAKLQQIVSKEIGESAFQTVGQQRFDRMWSSLPTLARKAGDPLGKIGEHDWAEMETKSTADAIQAIAPKIGTRIESVRRMLTTGKPLSDSKEDIDLYKKFKAAAADMNAVKMQSLIQQIDDLPLIQPGTNNSELLTRFLRGPAAQNMAGVYTQTTESNGMGDFLVGPLARGALERNIQTTAERLSQTSATITADKRATSRRLESGWAGRPEARANFILTSIPGVGKDGAAALQPFLKEQLSGFGTQAAAGVAYAMQNNTMLGVPVPNSQVSLLERQEAQMKAALQSHKFDDPRLEAYRKAAVRGWDESSTQASGFMDMLLDALKPGM